MFSLSFDRSIYLWNHHHYQDIIHFHHLKSFLGIFPVAQTLKNLPAMQETQVRFLDWEDPLEKGMAIHSSIFAWRIPWTEEPGGPQSVGSHRVQHYWATNTAAAAARALQSCPTLCDPIDGSPPGFPVPGILQATDTTTLQKLPVTIVVHPSELTPCRNSHWLAFCHCGLVCSFSRVLYECTFLCLVSFTQNCDLDFNACFILLLKNTIPVDNWLFHLVVDWAQGIEQGSWCPSNRPSAGLLICNSFLICF